MMVNSKKLMVSMAKREMRAADVANEAGLSRRTLSSVMQTGVCRTDTLGKIARALGVEPEQLMDMEG